MIIEDIGAPTTLILHHPHFFDASYWSGWSAETGCNVIAFDAPHHGANDKDQSFESFAIESAKLARHHFSGPIVAVGVSQGGVIAQETSGQPGVVGVVGISTTREAASKEESESMEYLLNAWGEGYADKDLVAGIAQGSTNGDEPAYSVTKNAVALFSGRRLRRSVPLLLARSSGRQLAVPALFIHGTEDRTYSLSSLTSHGVPVITVEGGSHSIALQSRGLVAAEIRSFIGSIAPELGYTS